MNLRGEIKTLINADIKEITETKAIEFNKTTDSMIQMMNQDWLKNKNNTLLLRGKYDKKNRGKYHWNLLRKFVMTSFKKNFQFNSEYLLAILEM